MPGEPKVEVERPRSAWQLFGATFALYRRFPWLFLILAAVVVIPYDALYLLGRPNGPLHGPVRVAVELVLTVADFSLVLPLISALHVHAVDDVRQARTPKVGSVARRGLATLPMVCAAATVSWLGIMAGLVALIVPGILLFLRWSVVAQVAALGGHGWRDALERSKSLTEGFYRHIFALFFLVVLITSLPSLPIDLAFGLGTTTVASFLVRTAVGVATSSFGALAIGLLYFDLSARSREEAREPVVPEASTDAPLSAPASGPGDPLTPDGYTDENRPPGWYIDPSHPRRMRYWAAGGELRWSGSTAKTPGPTLAEWRDLNKDR
jgi:hypothetical protein